MPSGTGGKARRTWLRFLPSRRGGEVEFLREGLWQRQVPLCDRGDPVRPHGDLREGCDLMRQLNCLVSRLAGWHKTVGQSDRQSLRAGNLACRQQHIQRTPGANQARQAHGCAVAHRHAPAARQYGKGCGFFRDTQVTAQRDAEPAGAGKPGDRGDNRFGQGVMTWPVGIACPGAVILAAGKRLEIRAGAEIPAGSGQDAARQSVICVEGAQRAGQGVRRFVIQRITDRRPVNRDDRDRTVLLKRQLRRTCFKCHSSPCGSVRYCVR